MALISCPHCAQTFEASTGQTAAIRAYAREAFKANPQAKVDTIVKAYLVANPQANVNTVMTQVRAAR